MKTSIEELTRRGHLAASWLAGRVDSNGGIPAGDDLGCYYKCVYPLRAAGYSALAAAVLDRIMATHLTDTGDLRNSPDRKTSGTYTSVFCQVYPNGWVALGAHLLGRYDAFRVLMKGLMDNYYDDELGTFRSSCLPVVDQFDVNSAAMAVELFILMDLNKARRAGDFLLQHLNGQPDPRHWYYSCIRKPFTYVTDLDSNNPNYMAVQIGKENESFWFLGLPAAALAQLYQATGEPRYLEGSRSFLETFFSCGEAGFRAPGSGKSFWASSMLYRVTGEDKYLSAALKLGDFFSCIQQDDGTFLLPGMKRDECTPKYLFDTVPEYARWFFEVAAELRSSPPRF